MNLIKLEAGRAPKTEVHQKNAKSHGDAGVNGEPVVGLLARYYMDTDIESYKCTRLFHGEIESILRSYMQQWNREDAAAKPGSSQVSMATKAGFSRSRWWGDSMVFSSHLQQYERCWVYPVACAGAHFVRNSQAVSQFAHGCHADGWLLHHCWHRLSSAWLG